MADTASKAGRADDDVEGKPSLWAVRRKRQHLARSEMNDKVTWLEERMLQVEEKMQKLNAGLVVPPVLEVRAPADGIDNQIADLMARIDQLEKVYILIDFDKIVEAYDKLLCHSTCDIRDVDDVDKLYEQPWHKLAHKSVDACAMPLDNASVDSHIAIEPEGECSPNQCRTCDNPPCVCAPAVLFQDSSPGHAFRDCDPHRVSCLRATPMRDCGPHHENIVHLERHVGTFEVLEVHRPVASHVSSNAGKPDTHTVCDAGNQEDSVQQQDLDFLKQRVLERLEKYIRDEVATIPAMFITEFFDRTAVQFMQGFSEDIDAGDIQALIEKMRGRYDPKDKNDSTGAELLDSMS